MQRAACERHRARLALNDARDAVQDLFAKGESIKSKAAASQKLVNEMSADIRVLDTAKTNLTSTITALMKRLHMIGNAVDQLRSAVQRREFVRAANLVEALEALPSRTASSRSWTVTCDSNEIISRNSLMRWRDQR